MKSILRWCILCAVSVLTVSAQQETLLKLWYAKPATQWVEALPVGNGRLGAMVYGNPSKETIQLNELTVWAGQPNRNDNPDAKEAMPVIRQMIFDGKYKEAQDLVNQKVITRTSHGMPYQTVGALTLLFPGHESFTKYYRELNIDSAVATTRYDVDGVTYTRVMFASFPDQVMILRVTASKPGMISFTASVNRPAPVERSTDGRNTLLMFGTSGDCDSVKGAVKFQAQVKIVSDGGSVSAADTSITVEKANAVTLYISIASGFRNYRDISADPVKKAAAYLRSAQKKPVERTLRDHVLDYQRYFHRVSIDLGVTDSIKLSTDVRIKQFPKAHDPQLAALYFQFGRYLLISSSRPGGQPATLQGIWNDQLFPPWDSKYTININTEMNYWPSENTNLSEMNEPLVQMIRELAVAGQQTARVMYGAEGWVAHHNTDIWRITGPIDGSFWGMWPMGGAWLSQHVFEKYEYSGDQQYLRSVYPIVKEAVKFFLSVLVEEPEHKWLVVTPSISPENAPASHPDVSIAAGTTMDNQLLFDLFTKTIRAATILKTDRAFIAQVEQALDRLPPMQIGQYGQLQEWLNDWDNPKDHHRHVSHLYGVFPSNQISAFRTPDLFDAARTTLLQRGDPSTGWSMNWKINWWAKLLDGNHAYKLVTDQIKLVDKPQFETGGTYANMFDAHPPFQIDGNFGFTSGVTEMLMQSDDGAVFVLPALPDVWNKGRVTGLRARGGFEIESMEWNNGKLSSLKLTSKLGGTCRIRSYSMLQSGPGTKLVEAIGENMNPFYSTPQLKKPLVSPKAHLNAVGVKQTYLYDLVTKPGGRYVISGK
ncbi:MAG TPA: glycoside hydrolase family 95 protein [Bacteroidota bacterium]|nr:glycoside hydrolase family 95 protein [Bacteroidota bacterium]